MRIVKLKDYKKALWETKKVLEDGGLVLFPSDTVYGLAVDPGNLEAVKKMFAFKDRWTGKAVSVCVSDKKMAEDYIEMTEEVKRVVEVLLPGPFTVVATGKHRLASGIEAENGSLGVRIPDNLFMIDLAKLWGRAFTCTSANITGKSPHYSVESFMKTLSIKKKGMIDLVVDGGKLAKNKPSTVIDVRKGEVDVLRRGDLIVGKEKTLLSKSERDTEKIAEFYVKRLLKKKDTEKAIVLALSGDLGCGKTVFSRAVGKILGVKEKINSPTFVIFNEYAIDAVNEDKSIKISSFLHFDLYRLSDKFEFEEIDFLGQFSSNTVACIEWPENMGQENLEKLREISLIVPVSFKYIDAKTREIKIEN